jgi:thiol-disulfide isomerase/thioredoxin
LHVSPVLLLSPLAGKAIAPIYEELSQKYPQVKFLKIDIDNPDMTAVVNDHGITGVVSWNTG